MNSDLVSEVGNCGEGGSGNGNGERKEDASGTFNKEQSML